MAVPPAGTAVRPAPATTATTAPPPPPVAVTVDVVALTLREGGLHVLLSERAAPPYRNHRALPGALLHAGREDLDQAAVRALAEETCPHGTRDALRRVHLEQLGSYGAPARDPRLHVVSVAYLAFGPDLPDPPAGATATAWHPVAALGLRPPTGRTPAAGGPVDTHGGGVDGPTGPPLAFDHARILADGLDRARAKLEYSPLATAFLPGDFTIPELRAVYEAVWSEKLHPGNFHRKVLSVPGFVESTGTTTERGGARGGPRARTYRAGGARLLHPALLRPAHPADGPGLC